MCVNVDSLKERCQAFAKVELSKNKKKGLEEEGNVVSYSEANGRGGWSVTD